MTSNIIQEWLMQFNKHLAFEGQHIFFLLDKATSHRVLNSCLSTIKIHFLPSNMTSNLQTLDSCIIKSFKSHYRKLQLQKMMELADAHLPTDLRLDYAMCYCKMVWDSVTVDNVCNCWNNTDIRFASSATVDLIAYGNLFSRIQDIFTISSENLMAEREFQLIDDSQEIEVKLIDDNFLVSTATVEEELIENDDVAVNTRLPSLKNVRTAAETVLFFSIAL